MPYTEYSSNISMPPSAKSDRLTKSVSFHSHLSVRFAFLPRNLHPPPCTLSTCLFHRSYSKILLLLLLFVCFCFTLGPEYKSQRKSQRANLPPFLICCLWPTVVKDDWKCPPAMLKLKTWNNFNVWSMHKCVRIAQRIVDIYFFSLILCSEQYAGIEAFRNACHSKAKGTLYFLFTVLLTSTTKLMYLWFAVDKGFH